MMDRDKITTADGELMQATAVRTFGWQPEWDAKLEELARSGVPMNAAIGQGDGGGEGDGGDAGEGEAGGGEVAADAGGEQQQAAGPLSGDLGGQQEEEGAAGVDLDALMGAFEGFRDDVTSRLEALPQQAAPAAAMADDPFSPDRFNLNDFDEEGNLRPEAQSRAIRDLVSDAVAEALQPERDARQRERINTAAAALEQRYPAMRDPQQRAGILNQARARAASLAQATGRPELAELWREPDFLETSYLAEAARAASASQTSAEQQSGVTLEAGGTAGPAGNQGGTAEDQLGDSIVGAAQSRRFRLGAMG